MRFLLFLLFASCLTTSCISKKKVAEAAAGYQANIDRLDDRLRQREDSIYQLTLALERARGANDAHLLTEDMMQDRIATREAQLEQLRGNLTSNNLQLSERLTSLGEELAATRASRDSLVTSQRATLLDFEDRTQLVADHLYDSLETKLPPGEYAISSRAGETTLSVQEDNIFQRNSVDRLVPTAEPLLRAVVAVLEQDPLFKLSVVAHTDNQPNPRRNTDNWAYAALRATRLARELADAYYLSPNRVSAASKGEFSPKKSNATEEGRRANRRIEFVFSNNVGNLLREMKKVE